MSGHPDLYIQLIGALHEKEQAQTSVLPTVDGRIKAIADLLLENDNQLDAAFAYYVAGYYARSYSLIYPIASTLVDVPAVQRWLSLFLAKEFETLENELESNLTDPLFSDEGIRGELEAGDFANRTIENQTVESQIIDRILSRVVAECFDEFLRFVRTGDEDRLTTVYYRLKICDRLALKAREDQWWWWLVCTRFAMQEFRENSLWSCLRSMRAESDIVTQYIQANYKRDNPVIALWRSQIESLQSVNDPERRSYCLKMPTGAGKTRVAELMLLRFLIDYQESPDLKCVYIAPFRTLASEVEDTLAASFNSIPHAVVSQFYGGYEIDPLDQADLEEARILVMTPEKLDGTLRQKPELMSKIRLILVDEGHLIAEENPRGRKYQMLLQRLIYVLKIKRERLERRGTRLLLISGVLPSVNAFAKWLTGDSNNVIISSWRPIEEPQFGDLIWDGKRLVRSDTNDPIYLPVNTALGIQNLLDSGTTQGQEVFSEVVARVAVHFATTKTTMLFSASKNLIKSERLLSAIDAITREQGLFGNNPIPVQLRRNASFGRYYTLLERGVAVHHADLPVALRHEMEKQIRERKVPLVLASPTLAQGVNLPVHCVLVYGLEHQPGERISDTMFWNVVGRIGRPLPGVPPNLIGIKPEIWFLLDRSHYFTKDETYRSELLSQRDNYRVANALLQLLRRIKELWQANGKDESVANLVTLLAENNLSWINDDQQRSEIQAFLSEIDAFLNDLSREARLNSDLGRVEDCLQDVTEELIALFEGIDPLSEEDSEYVREAIRARASFIVKNIPELQREREYLLGLPEQDRSLIQTHQEELLEWYKATEALFRGELEKGLESLGQIIGVISGLSIVTHETRPKHTTISLGSGATLFDVSEIPKSNSRQNAFKAWVRGEEPIAIARFLPNTDLDDYREKVFERDLPWAISALGRFMASLAQERNFNLPHVLDYLPALVKYGVPTPIACHLVRMKLSRTAARKLSDLCMADLQSDVILGLPVLTLDDLSWSRETTLMFIRDLTEEDISQLGLSPADQSRLTNLRRGNAG